MRAALLLSIAILLSACATPPRQWEKPGADRETAKAELGDCRRSAKSEAWRAQTDRGFAYPRYAGRPSTYGYYGRSNYYAADSERLYDERRLVNFCMRNKGYEMNPAPTDISPTSPPR